MSISIKKYLLCLILPFAAFSADEIYNVSLLGVNVARVHISVIPFPDHKKEIVFKAETVGLFDKLYNVNNTYNFYTDENIDSLLYYHKEIHQKDFRQYYNEIIRNDTIYHKNFYKTPVSARVHHILSFLVYFRYHPDFLQGDTLQKIIISDEGELYYPHINVKRNDRKRQYEVFFQLEKISGEEILNPTDVFNWKVCAMEAERMVAYSYDDYRITEAAFALGMGIRLRAKRIDR